MPQELKTLLILSVRANMLWPSDSLGKWARGRPEHRLYAIPMSSEHPEAIHGCAEPDAFSASIQFRAHGRLGEAAYPNHPKGVGAVAQAMLVGKLPLTHLEGPDFPSLGSIALGCGIDCVGAKAVFVGTFSGKGPKSISEQELAPMLLQATMALIDSPSMQGARFISEDGSPRLIDLGIDFENISSRIWSACDDLRLRLDICEPETSKGRSPRI